MHVPNPTVSSVPEHAGLSDNIATAVSFAAELGMGAVVNQQPPFEE